MCDGWASAGHVQLTHPSIRSSIRALFTNEWFTGSVLGGCAWMCEACGVSGLVCGRSTYVRGLRADLLLPRPVLFLSRGRQLKCSTACGLMGHPFRCTGLAGQQSRCKDCVVCADVQPRCRTRRARSEGPVGVTGGAKPLHQTGCQGWYAPACVGEPMSTVTPPDSMHSVSHCRTCCAVAPQARASHCSGCRALSARVCPSASSPQHARMLLLLWHRVPTCLSSRPRRRRHVWGRRPQWQ